MRLQYPTNRSWNLSTLSVDPTLTMVAGNSFDSSAFASVTVATTTHFPLIDLNGDLPLFNPVLLIFRQGLLDWWLFDLPRFSVCVRDCPSGRDSICSLFNDMAWYASFCNGASFDSNKNTYNVQWNAVLLLQIFVWEHIRRKQVGT